jgi:lytic murein transglycosylase
MAGLALALGLVGSGSALAQSCQNNPGQFPAWLDAFRAEAAAAGISQNSIAALNGVSYRQDIVNRDRAQGVFSQTFLEFSDRMVSQYRLDTGASRLNQYSSLFASVEQQTGVPGAVIVAFWALETDFGANTGDENTISALATLAFDCRRPEKFRPQLLDALRILDRGDLVLSQLRGAWAGEIGQVQFQPTDYLRSGVDADGNGRVDLLNDTADVIASAGNLIAYHGWQRGQPWLEEVTLTQSLPWEQADVYNMLPRSQWAAWGVVRRDGSALPSDRTPSSLLLPMGRNGPAFLAYDNFHVFLDWNESLVYSLTAAYLATRFAGAPRVSPGGTVNSLSLDQIRELQRLLAAQGFNVGEIDGIIGAQTRIAVRTVQLQLGLPADGYPTTELLGAMRGTPVPAGLSQSQIAELQSLLAALGYDVGPIDGVMGSRTRAAVMAVQQQLGLPADGVPTEELLQRLRG